MRIPESLIGAVTDLLEDRMRRADCARPKRATLGKIDRPPAGSATVLDAVDAREALETMFECGIQADVVMLDPWYRDNDSAGRGAYLTEMVPLLSAAARVGQHVFLWGLPQTLARAVDFWPQSLFLDAWLTWYYRNIPSRSRAWRPNQQACLHLRRPGSRMFGETFLSDRHREMAERNVLVYRMGAPTAFHGGLLSGFIKRHEQTGHEAQKPVSVMQRLLQMTMPAGGLVVDPTAGSGTTGIAAMRLGGSAIISDRRPSSTQLMRQRVARELAIARSGSPRRRKEATDADQEFEALERLFDGEESPSLSYGLSGLGPDC